jgi:sulfatase maturation enzyme AslB (radical SAM superfamily)
MGNVWDYVEISEAFMSQGFKLLLKEAIDRRYKCQQCEIFAFCAGGCNNVALNENGISNNNGTTCKITKSVYMHVMDYMRSNKDSVYNPVVKKIISKRRIVKDCHCDMHFDSYENSTI